MTSKTENKDILQIKNPRIAIIQRDGIGDTLVTIPLLHWCKKYLNADITLINSSRSQECIEHIQNPPWNKVKTFSAKNRYIQAAKTILFLRKERFDIALSAKTRPMTLITIITAASKATIRRCITKQSTCTKPIEAFINSPISEINAEAHRHQAENELHLLAPLKTQLTGDLYPRIKKANETDCKRLEEDCTASGMPRNQATKRITINITNNRQKSKLQLEQIIEILKRLSDIPIDLILIATSKDEAEATQWQHHIKSTAKRPATLIVGEKLSSTLAAIQSSDVVLTGDGGFMHMTAACNRNQLALFGSTPLEKWRPLSDNTECIHHPVSVSLIPAELIANKTRYLLDRP